jgi:5-methylcytosine-specific restriction endonuclease McrA
MDSEIKPVESGANNQNLDLEAFDINPGIELRKFFENLYPINSGDGSQQESFLDKIDQSLNAEGDLTKLVYDSIIRYLIRRFINTSEFIRRLYQSDSYPEEFYIEKTREFIQSETNIQGSDSEKLLAILQLCISEKNKNRRSINKKKFISKFYAEDSEILCYICGKSLTIDELEIEHKWPKTMGGSYAEENLKASCKECNKVKESFIDSSDFHYEHISLSLLEEDDYFKSQFKRIYKIALCSRHSYSCSICGQPTELVGRLNFVRKNENDSWHFLNINTICNNCLIEDYAGR